MDSGINQGTRELHITRSFAAPRALVFKAWTQPEHMARWWGCSDKVDVRITNDLRVGGTFKAEMDLADGSLHVISGTYREIDAPDRLSFTWTWKNGGAEGSNTLVTIDFEDEGEGTRMIFRHEQFETVEECRSHGEGWTASFDRLTDIASAL